MRKGTSLLLLAIVALACATCLWGGPASDVLAATLEPTDSGAPSAIVIFPVGDNPGPKPAAMEPVAFNHVIHEKWMVNAGKDCMVCHHTGDPVACTNCHTVDGIKEGKFINLHRAMHVPQVKPRKENTPSSCVSCHEAQLKRRDCAGCHTQLVKNAREQNEWCTVCHTITPAMTQTQMREGIENKLPESANEALATETALARKQAKYWSPMLAPYKVLIDSLSGNSLTGKYQPCNFNHRHHVADLMNRIEDCQLAGAFHTEPATICVTCHHNSPPSATPPKCESCHTKTINKNQPGKPALMAAFHLQCMNCHKDMKVARPRNTDCTTCHKPRPVQGASN